MIIHRYHDGSEGYEYEVGDRVYVDRTVGGGWFDYGPTRSSMCIVSSRKQFPRGSPPSRIDDYEVRYSKDWGPVSVKPWMLRPHYDALLLAKIVPADSGKGGAS